MSGNLNYYDDYLLEWDLRLDVDLSFLTIICVCVCIGKYNFRVNNLLAFPWVWEWHSGHHNSQQALLPAEPFYQLDFHISFTRFYVTLK